VGAKLPLVVPPQFLGRQPAHPLDEPPLDLADIDRRIERAAGLRVVLAVEVDELGRLERTHQRHLVHALDQLREEGARQVQPLLHLGDLDLAEELDVGTDLPPLLGVRDRLLLGVDGVALADLGRGTAVWLRLDPERLLLFDPATVADQSTFEDPKALSVGIAKVWVNGVPVWQDGKASGKFPGRAIRRP